MVTGYEPAVTILQQNKRFSNAGRMAALLDALPEQDRSRFQPIYDHFAVGMIRCDPPDHTRLRRLISAAFTPRVIQDQHADIQAIVDELIDAFALERPVDLIGEFAYLLPATVICRMLGVPNKDLNRVRDWSERINSIIAGMCPLRQAAERTQGALLELQEYFGKMIAERRRQSQDDLMSLLVTAESEGDRLTELELLSTAENLLAAGHETTKALISNGILTLLQHPLQLEHLRKHPDLMPGAIEEMLRFESPVQRQTRVVREDTELCGQNMRRGQVVFVMIGAANRDPSIFPDPDHFDIRRDGNRQIAFGKGPHFCIGAPLSRMESQIALGTLLDRFEHIKLICDQVQWAPTAAVRAPMALPVQLS